MKLFIPILILISVGLGLAAQSPAEVSRRHEAVSNVAARAAEGDAEALYQLSTLHERGYDTIPRDTIRSVVLLRQAAERGYAPAANLLGYKLIKGEGMPRNPSEGLAWIEKAANAGDAKALGNIGYLILSGEGNDSVVSLSDEEIRANELKAAEWLIRAADRNIITAQSLLGDLYRDGRGVNRDSLEAEALYRKAFEGGLTDAAYKLADIRRQKIDSMSAPEILSEGLYYFNRTAPSVGVKLFSRVVEEENQSESPELRAKAMALLGDAYSRGRGVDYNYNLSTLYYLTAAQEGNPSAQFVIGEMLEIFPDALNEFSEEKSLIPEEKRASYWLELAAEGGVHNASEAMRQLHSF